MARSSAPDILWNLIEPIPVFSTACARRGTVQCRGGEIDAKTQEVDVGKIQNVARRRAGRHRETTAARSYGLFLPERPQPTSVRRDRFECDVGEIPEMFSRLQKTLPGTKHDKNRLRHFIYRPKATELRRSVVRRPTFLIRPSRGAQKLS
jgi:hypothetical protein